MSSSRSFKPLYVAPHVFQRTIVLFDRLCACRNLIILQYLHSTFWLILMTFTMNYSKESAECLHTTDFNSFLACRFADCSRISWSMRTCMSLWKNDPQIEYWLHDDVSSRCKRLFALEGHVGQLQDLQLLGQCEVDMFQWLCCQWGQTHWTG